MTCQVVICCGSGGVGKTTVSAALAVKWALRGKRVAVLTIDPARRLADSLSIGALSNTAKAVPLDGLGGEPGGHLDAMMLDAKKTFDELVGRLASSEAAAQRILENRYYRFASARLGGSHEYMAMERLLGLAESGQYDIVVLDTPPTRQALDFLRAPDRMAGLMDQGVLRWLTMPARKGGWRALEMGSEAVAKVLKRLLGQGTIGEIAEFFDAFLNVGDGMNARSKAVHALLRAPKTRFLLVTSPATTVQKEALLFLRLLVEKDMPFGGFVINRVQPPPTHTLSQMDLPEGLSASAQQALLQANHLQHSLASTHQQSISTLRAAAPTSAQCWQIAEQGTDVHDLHGLAALGQALPVYSEIP